MAFAPKKKVSITAPNIQTAKFKIVGTAQYVSNKFSTEVLVAIAAKQAAGSTAAKGGRRDAKDFDALAAASAHKDMKGDWYGIPSSVFRKGMISACRLLGFPMTLAKLSIFTVADGVDDGGAPLTRITKGKPHRVDSPVKNDGGGMDIRPRYHWDAGWEACPVIRFDADQFTLADVTNLLARMGMQVGIGAGRPDSSDSAGMEWGTFEIAGTTK